MQTVDPKMIHQIVQALLIPAIGLGGAPFIREFVQIVKTQLRLPSIIIPLFAIASGIVLDVFLAFYFGFSLVDGLILGIVTGASASAWNEITK